MTLMYTEDQLIREAQLLVAEVALLADFVVGEGAGIRALGLSADAPFAQSRHPDDLADVQEMALFPAIRRVERYVRDHTWSEDISLDITTLRVAIERTFSPAVIEAYEIEREGIQEHEVPDALAKGAGDVPVGCFHRGILADLVARASARLKVDRGERLTMADIALLLGVREATVITNAHRKNFHTVEDENRRYAEPRDALPWMVKQGYVPTTGRTETAPADRSQDCPCPPVEFVPVARDGTWFSPACRINGRFTIGPKGSEEKYEDYFEALGNLVRMPTPYWRRRNTNGIPGIVAGVRFERMRRTDLERALA